ncbi:MAG: hypothetical protein K8I60_09085 [Anaerolineae bacterium]|nr:hypothetical protein [Anaerolineae bacterium]
MMPLNTTGEKIISRTHPASAILYQPGQTVWALTNRRLIPVDAADIPLTEPGATSDYLLYRPHRSEKENLVGLLVTP